MKAALSTAAVTAALLATPHTAHAYWGLGAGPSRIDIQCAGTLTCDTSDFGAKGYFGWHLPGPFAIELTGLYWGRAESTSPGGNGLKTRAYGLGAQGVWIVSFGWGQCDVRAGAAFNRATTDLTSSGATSTSHHNLLAPYLGFGCAYPLSPGLTLTAAVDFSRIKYTASDKANTRLITIGLRF